MKKKRNFFNIVISVHAGFDESAYLSCQKHQVHYSYIIRNPIDQIDSCYNHCCILLLKDNDPNFMKTISPLFSVLEKIGIDTTLPNILFTYALHYILVSNLRFLEFTDATILKTEKIFTLKINFLTSFNHLELSNENISYFDKEKFL